MIGRARVLGLFLLSQAACGTVLGLDGMVADRDTGDAAPCGSRCVDAGGEAGTGQVVVTSPKGTYGIDALEVTLSDYQTWLATKPSLAGQRAECTWNDSYEITVASQAALAAGAKLDPGCTPDILRALPSDGPVVCMDFCDAAAYCASLHKRMCGKIGGGSLSVAYPDALPAIDAAESEWFRACTGGDQRAYPYGNDYRLGACNDANSWPVKVGSHPGCEGGAAGLFDMSGNVSEWVDECAAGGSGAPSDNCLNRGGAFFSKPDALRCDARQFIYRGSVSSTTGFRCCGSS
jgi:formylglycine-generating enzyme required for sulfatase activity